MIVETMMSYLAGVQEAIATRGWAVRAVSGSSETPSRCYSIGLTTFDHPELLLIGCEGMAGMRLIETVCARVKDGQRFRDWSVLRGPQTIVFRNVAPRHLRSIAPIAARLFSDYQVLQLVLPDPTGQFPWQPTCQPKSKRQMCLTYTSSAEGIAIL